MVTVAVDDQNYPITKVNGGSVSTDEDLTKVALDIYLHKKSKDWRKDKLLKVVDVVI